MTMLLSGRGDREYFNGATVEGDSLIHLGILATRATACGKTFKNFMLTSSDVTVNCTECVAEVDRRQTLSGDGPF